MKEELKRIFELNDVYIVHKFVGKNKQKKVKNRTAFEKESYAIYADNQTEAVQWCRENSEYPNQWTFYKPYNLFKLRPKHLSLIKYGEPVETDGSGETQYEYITSLIK